MLVRNNKKRRGAAMVEVAVLIPIMVVLVALAIDVVTGVFRFHQVATLARTGARYAATAPRFNAPRRQPRCHDYDRCCSGPPKTRACFAV